jgi:hypothetical protein
MINVDSTSNSTLYHCAAVPWSKLQLPISGTNPSAPTVVPITTAGVPSVSTSTGIAVTNGQDSLSGGKVGGDTILGAGEVVGGPRLVGAGVVGGIARISSSNSPSQLIAPGSPYPETTI